MIFRKKEEEDIHERGCPDISGNNPPVSASNMIYVTFFD
jgi:hypothetical protein